MQQHLLKLYLLGLCLLLVGCALPPHKQQPSSQALDLTSAQQTTLGKAIQPLIPPDPSLSGFNLINNPYVAFSTRLQMIRAADKTLDVQYYIWKKDTAGLILLNELLLAAQRGVRIRLLLDDNGIAGMDRYLASLNQQPNFAIRLFNPFVIRNAKILSYVVDFARLNKRMHNKSLTADNQITIVGGRNIGNEYFSTDSNVFFTDLDVLAIGNISQQVSQDFDKYWQSQASYELTSIIKKPSNHHDFNKFLHLTKQAYNSKRGQKYLNQAEHSENLSTSISQHHTRFDWAPIHLASDDPSKALNNHQLHNDYLIDQFKQLLTSAQHSLLIVSPYFVPTKAGSKELIKLAAKQVKVTVLTNSLAATDVAIVFASYHKYRKQLLSHNIKLYEMAAQTTSTKHAAKLINPPEQKRHFFVFGSAYSSLHAKIFIIDQRWVFIGSFNFDPRSALLNTELGFILDDPRLANLISTTISSNIDQYAYELKLEDNKLSWQILDDKQQIKRYFREPETSIFKRAFVKIMRRFPIEWLL